MSKNRKVIYMILLVFTFVITYLLSVQAGDVVVYQAGAQMPDGCMCPVMYGNCYCVSYPY
jgi:hypothetical protein